ncbi:MAG: histidine kinase [Deltaproteobacteria bacterium HGW-Deltaproteobacteria-23]|jgi:two-component system sensor histidine kinase HydH|nr:MAG: histidine kinase [Deltaproteobacteria bacterium HGW-Deltaproteobacteria-23]
MTKTTRLLIGIPLCFTLLVAWFAWSAFRVAPPLAVESLRGAGLSIAAAIEQLIVADSSFRSLERYSTPDIAYFALIDRQGIVRFHTNQGLIDKQIPVDENKTFVEGVSEQRERLGTGEEVYLLRKKVHTDHDEYLLVLALHTYRADQVIRRAKAGVSVVSALTVALWCLTLLLLFMLRREGRHHMEMNRREELARLGEMGAVMAHEIRNPLAGIKGFAQLVETATDIEQARSHAKKIVHQSLRMESLVNDLLSFSRNDQGARQITDLLTVIMECVALLRSEAAAQQVEVKVEAPKPLQAAVDVDRIFQLLLNLMKNAIQAMPDGGVLDVVLYQKNKFVYINVKDSGSGIIPEDLLHIFEPFWTSKAQGTGLGLALCKKVAEEHGGSLTVESSVNVGTEFVVTLPEGT